MATQEKTKVFNLFNAAERPKRGKQFTKPSLTIPDQTLTPRELLDRHARGMNLQGYTVPKYGDENQQGLDIRKMDLVDIQNLKIKTKENIETLKKGDQH